MTDYVIPSPGSTGDGYAQAVITVEAALSDGWIVDSGSILGGVIVPETAIGGFDYSQAQSSGTTAVIKGGEAFVGGGWLLRTGNTDVDLGDSAGTYTIYVGWAATAQDTVIIGTSSSFGTNDKKIPILEAVSDGSTITGTTDLRIKEPTINVKNDYYDGGSGTVSDATNVTSTYKGNDIDTNNDGQVNSADNADHATNSDKLGGVVASNYTRGTMDLWEGSTEPTGWADGDIWFKPKN